MSMILTVLKTIKLSLAQYAALVAATLIGGLVLALKLQGSRLHAAQLQLLQIHVNSSLEKPQEVVDKARERYNQAMTAYKASGGV